VIRFLTAVAVALLSVAVVAVPTSNANPVVGSVYDGYFTYGADGYFHYGNASYTRQWVSSPGYYSYGYYYPGYAYYKYTQYAVPQTYSTVPAYSPKWKEEFVKYDEYIADHAAYLETLSRHGINGQTLPFLQGGPAYKYGYNANLGSYGANGQTLYGYSYQQVQQAYGGLNLNTMYQQAGRLTQGAQALAGQAHTETIGLADNIANNAARVSEVLAKGEAAERALRAANAPASSTTVTTVSGASAGATTGTGVSGGLPAGGSAPAGDVRAFVANIVTPACGGCHSGADPKAKLDLTKWESMTPDVHALVLERLTSQDEKKRMPRDKDGHAGNVTREQLLEFVRYQ
jgi:hypothetical protein